MIELSLKDIQADFRRLFSLNPAHKLLCGFGHIVYEFNLRYSQALANLIGRRSIVRM